MYVVPSPFTIDEVSFQILLGKIVKVYLGQFIIPENDCSPVLLLSEVFQLAHTASLCLNALPF